MITGFKIGEKVWCYQAPCFPYEGEIIEILDYAIRCHIDSKLSPDRVWSKFQVFKRPEEKSKLVAQISDDADCLDRYAKELQENED